MESASLNDAELAEAIAKASVVIGFSHYDTGQDGLTAIAVKLFESDELVPIERHKLAHMLMDLGAKLHDACLDEMEEEADRG